MSIIDDFFSKNFSHLLVKSLLRPTQSTLQDEIRPRTCREGPDGE